MKLMGHASVPAIFAVLLALSPVGHASSVPADRVHFCMPAYPAPAGQSVDPEQWVRYDPRPAGKWAAHLNVGEPRTVRPFCSCRTTGRIAPKWSIR